MKITICGSIAFYSKMTEVKKQLEQLGHEVKIPPTTIKDGDGNDITVEQYYEIRKQTSDLKSWVWDTKTVAMKAHFDKVTWSDAILVLNYEKNNITGYIGANTFLEMGLALHLDKIIYVLNPLPEKISYFEELQGMKPVIINADLKLIQ